MKGRLSEKVWTRGINKIPFHWWWYDDPLRQNRVRGTCMQHPL